MVCKNCGANIPNGELFCPNCGTRTENANSVNTAAAVIGADCVVCPACGQAGRAIAVCPTAPACLCKH